MTVTHKRTFFDNIPSCDENMLVREIKRLIVANQKERSRFDVEAHRRLLLDKVGAEATARIMEAALRPYGAKMEKKPAQIITGADLARVSRSAKKTKMRSHRQPR